MSTLRIAATLAGQRQVWDLTEAPARVGRASSNAVQLLDGTVSKEHAEFTRTGDAWSLRDLGSRNGTRVNGEDAREGLPVKEGDWIEIGHVELRVEGPERTTARYTVAPGVGSSLKIKVKDLLQRTPSATGAESARVLHLLAEAGQMLVLPRPLRETCEDILKFVESAVPANRLVVLLRENDGEEPVQIASRITGRAARGAREGDPLALSQTIMKAVLDENTAVITGDAANDPRFMASHSIIAQSIHSAMAVPLWDNQRVLGLLYVDSTEMGVIYGQSQLELLTLLANMVAVKITNARLLVAEQARQRMAQELSTATRIQRALLPEFPTGLGAWSFCARIETCHEVGGDLYDFHQRADGTVVVLVGDVSGKGMGAAMLMSSAITSARVLYEECKQPLDLVLRLNAVMHRSSDARSFLTLFAGYLDPNTGAFRYVNAGHPEPHLARGDRMRTLAATGIPVGMLDAFPWTQEEVTIESGETLAIFSDGIPEAQHGEEFFDFERLGETFMGAATEADLERAAARIIDAVDAFAAGEHRSDDVTLVLLRRA